MKKYLLLLVITLGISVITAQAQNYIGKTKSQITRALDERGIDYEVYYTTGGDEGIRYEADGEKRTYLIGLSGLCNWYLILNNNQDFFYKARKYAIQLGFRQVSVGDDYIYTYKKTGSKILVGPCPEDADENSIFYGWTYFMIYDAN